MSDAQRPMGGPAAPRPSKPAASQKRGGMLGRVGQMLGGKSKEPTDPALALRESLAGKLPATDPLRAARLQTHLFMGQLPAFPSTEEKPLAAAPADKPESGGIAALRAEKQSRDAAKAEAAEIAARDPARQRVETLRQRRQQELRAADRRPASAPTRVTPQTTSKATQAAAARTPARVALSKAAAGAATSLPDRPGGRGRSGGGLNGILLLLLLVTLALILAGAYWGYNWYQNQSASTQTDTLSPDLFDQGTNSPDLSVPATTDPVVPAVPAVPVEEEADPVDPFALEESIRQTTVLLLEQELNRQSFMADGRDVDGEYTAATLGALRSFANTTVNPALAQEVLDAGLRPTQEQLETWQSILDDFL